ncbi:MAG: hypothetical protein ABC542_02755 [Candidatus Methanosuratincola petrocarbonis]
MAPKGWKPLSIREETYEAIKRFVSRYKKRASIGGFIDEAVQEKLEREELKAKEAEA